MDNKTVAVLAIAFIVVVGAGLAVAYAFNGHDSNKGEIKSYDSSYNTKTITVKPGDLFNVTLDENPTTGYGWQVNATSGLRIVGDYNQSSESGAIGVGRIHIWQIEATGAGDQVFSGIYKRSWEPTFGNETTYTINVKIS